MNTNDARTLSLPKQSVALNELGPNLLYVKTLQSMIEHLN